LVRVSKVDLPASELALFVNNLTLRLERYGRLLARPDIADAGTQRIADLAYRVEKNRYRLPSLVETRKNDAKRSA
jgi:hypothetical protein